MNYIFHFEEHILLGISNTNKLKMSNLVNKWHSLQDSPHIDFGSLQQM